MQIQKNKNIAGVITCVAILIVVLSFTILIAVNLYFTYNGTVNLSNARNIENDIEIMKQEILGIEEDRISSEAEITVSVSHLVVAEPKASIRVAVAK